MDSGAVGTDIFLFWEGIFSEHPFEGWKEAEDKLTLPPFIVLESSTGEGTGAGVHIARTIMNNNVRSRVRGAAFMEAALLASWDGMMMLMMFGENE